jgi:hypothetical protein
VEYQQRQIRSGVSNESGQATPCRSRVGQVSRSEVEQDQPPDPRSPLLGHLQPPLKSLASTAAENLVTVEGGLPGLDRQCLRFGDVME